MASYETEFLQALNMASQSASGLLKSIREPDYEEKLAMQTAQQKELMEHQGLIDMAKLDDKQEYGMRVLTKEQKGLWDRLGISIKSEKDIVDAQITSQETIVDKKTTSQETIVDKTIESQEKIVGQQLDAAKENLVIRIDEEKRSQESSQTWGKMMQDDSQEFKMTFQNDQQDFILDRDLNIHGYAVEMLGKGHSNDIDLTNLNHTNKIAQMRENKNISQDMAIFMTKELPKYQRMAVEDQHEWLTTEIKWYKNGGGTGPFSMKTRAEIYMLAQNDLAQASAEDNFEWTKGKGFSNWVANSSNGFITFDSTGMKMKQVIMDDKYGDRQFNVDMYRRGEINTQNLGFQLTHNQMFKDISPDTKTSLLGASAGYNSIYAGMDTDNTLVNTAIYDSQRFALDATIANINNSVPLIALDPNKRTDDYDMPDKPNLLFKSKLTGRGKEKYTEYVTEGKNKYTNVAANLLTRYQVVQNEDKSRKFKKELKLDFKKGIIMGNQLVDAAVKVKANAGLIKALQEKTYILETYLKQL